MNGGGEGGRQGGGGRQGKLLYLNKGFPWHTNIVEMNYKAITNISTQKKIKIKNNSIEDY